MKTHERFRLHVQVDDEPQGASMIAVAFVANVLVAIAKTAAAMLTGSSSLRTEAVHSWVDVGNECFVVVAARTAKRPADETHALGYGRESYVWSLFASLGMLAVGAVVGIWQGIEQLGEPEADAHYTIGYAVLGLAFVLEGGSFLQTLREVRKGADELGRDVFEHAFATSNAPMRAVFVEDFTALISLVIAAMGMSLHQFTGVAAYDAIGSILIGTLMALAALMMISRNGRYLAGKTIPPDQRCRVLDSLRSNPEIKRVTFVYAEFIGPDRLLVMAGVEVTGDPSQAELATILRDVERRMMKHRYVGLVILTLAKPDDPALVAEM